MRSNNSCSAIILAAGRSKRMGKSKLMLENADGISILNHITGLYKNFGCQMIVVVVNPEDRSCLEQTHVLFPENAKVIVNFNAERGRFSSVKTGLELLKEQPCVFLHNIDTPVIRSETLKKLFNNLGSADVAIPYFAGKGGHPVLMRRKLVRAILGQESEEMNLRDFFKDFKKAKVEVDDPGVLVNLNTMQEFMEWKDKWSKNA